MGGGEELLGTIMTRSIRTRSVKTTGNYRIISKGEGEDQVPTADISVKKR